MFGIKLGRLSAEEQKMRHTVAKRHGCTWVYLREGNNTIKSWFSGPNRGEPFDSALARAVYADIKQEVG